MRELIEMVGLLAIVFGVSVAVSYLFFNRRPRKVQLIPLAENTSVRMIGPGGAYRCYFLRQDHTGLIFSAPLQRDRYVPLRSGEMMMVQAATDSAVLTFRAAVVSRKADTHEFTLARPERVRHVERRAELRDTSYSGMIGRINGTSATLQNLSAGGACVVTASPVRAGDHVTLDLPMGLGEVQGWALESTATAQGRTLSRAVRIRFEVPLAGLRPVAPRKAAWGES